MARIRSLPATTAAIELLGEFVDAGVLEREVLRQRNIVGSLPILADLLRADVQCFELTSSDRVAVVVHAQPHSTQSIYPANRKGTEHAVAADAHLIQAIRNGVHVDDADVVLGDGSAHVHREFVPLFDRYGDVTGAVGIEMSDTEHARHRAFASADYLAALRLLKYQALRAGLPGAESLTAFTARDGIVVIAADRMVQFASNIAAGMYARIGVAPWQGRVSLERLESGDDQIVRRALATGQCHEQEAPARDAVWRRRAIPLRGERAPSFGRRGWRAPDNPPKPVSHVLLLLSDVTEERRLQREEERLANAEREIHHRVRNNLQTIISYARVEGRNARSPETRKAIGELANRVFAVAKVHEYLATDGSDVVDLRQVSRQIADELHENLLPPSARVRIEVEGDPILLPSKQATQCALVVTELIQNAVEHAFDGGPGLVRILCEDSPDRVHIAVVDDGRGMPPQFDWRTSQSLGLKIARNTMQDLRGELTLANRASPEHGVIAELSLSRLVPGGR